MVQSLNRWRPSEMRRRAEGLSREERLEKAERAFAYARKRVRLMRRELAGLAIFAALINAVAVIRLDEPRRWVFIAASWVGGVIAIASFAGSNNRLKWWLTVAALACPVLGYVVFRLID
jgi:hypothetical protein